MQAKCKKGFMSHLLNAIYVFVGLYVVAVLVGLLFGVNEPTTLTTCVFTIGLGESGLTSLIQRSKLKSSSVLKDGDRHMQKILTSLYVTLGIYTILALAIYYISGLEPAVLTAGLFAAVLGESGWCSSIQVAKYQSEAMCEDSNEMPISLAKK